MKKSPLNKLSQSRTAKNRRAQDAQDRKALKKRTLLCELCEQEGFSVTAVDLHHMRTKASHPELRHVPANWVALCRHHHTCAHENPNAMRQWFIATRPEDAKEIGLA